MGTEIIGESKSIEYSTPLKIVEPLIKEFNITRDVCASFENHKLPDYWTKEDNALIKTWKGNCWMNPPFSRDLNKWVRKAYAETYGPTTGDRLRIADTELILEVEKDLTSYGDDLN